MQFWILPPLPSPPVHRRETSPASFSSPGPSWALQAASPAATQLSSQLLLRFLPRAGKGWRHGPHQRRAEGKNRTKDEPLRNEPTKPGAVKWFGPVGTRDISGSLCFTFSPFLFCFHYRSGLNRSHTFPPQIPTVKS